jgi:hypothetical protein
MSDSENKTLPVIGRDFPVSGILSIEKAQRMAEFFGVLGIQTAGGFCLPWL